MRTQTPPSGRDATSTGSPLRTRPAGWHGLSWLNRDLVLLFTGRGLRSLAQGYLAIIVPLYLARLGFDAIHLGALFTASAIVSAVLAAAIGLLADRLGRKPFLVLIGLLMAGGGLAFALSRDYIVLLLAGALGTIGRGGGAGSGGAWGPYYPAEQALIAEQVSDTQRTNVFGALSFVGVIAGAAGSLLAAVPRLVQGHTGVTIGSGDRALFLFTVVLGLAMALVVLPVRERGSAPRLSARQAPTPAASSAARRKAMGLSRPSWHLVSRFMITNTTNGLAIGMLGPMLVYWFYRRYGVNADALAGLFFAVNLAAALPYLLAGRLARAIGAVNTVVTTRAISVVLLAVMALMPIYPLAAALFLVRMCANTLSNPVRQSYLMGVIPPDERASAAGLANLPSQVATAITPSLGGYLMQAVALDMPLELAAALQGINTILYYTFFHAIRPPEERTPSRTVQ